jgi:hypothetical protein
MKFIYYLYWKTMKIKCKHVMFSFTSWILYLFYFLFLMAVTIKIQILYTKIKIKKVSILYFI